MTEQSSGEVRTVRAVEDLGMIKGATAPHIMACDDGKSYLVKFAGPNKSAVNEYVGQTLARRVGLPAPPSVFVDVPQVLIAAAPDLRRRRVGAGLHHGSQMVSGALELGQFLRANPGGVGLVNLDHLPQTLCHDNWVLTRDRERDDNHMVENLGDGRYRYTMVDFSHGFTGPDWTADSIEQGSYLRVLEPVHPFITDLVTGTASFEPVLTRIESTTDEQIEALVSSIPPAWNVSPDELSCLTSFLEVRRGLLREILTSVKRLSFPHWTEG